MEVGVNSNNQADMPELKIKTESWIRESHGLYDYEGTELEVLNYTLKGNQRFKRTESKVTVEQIQNDQLEECEVDFSSEEREKIICRFFYRNDSYWVYHKNFLDETAELVNERKPEEKIWQVVKSTFNQEMDFPCYKIQRKDLIKVGRVRFKIRDVMSPVYKKIQEAENLMSQKFNMIYPSFNDSSIADSASHTHSSLLISGGNEDKRPRVNSFERMGDHFLNSDRDNRQIFNNDVSPNANTQPIIFSGLNLNQVLPDDELGYDQNQVVSRNDVFQFAQGNPNELSVDSEDVERLNRSPQLLFEKRITSIPDSPIKFKPKQVMDMVSHSSKEAPVCRICLMEDNEQCNPLFSPCKCSGSMKFIHHLCLKTWFQGKRIMKVNPVVSTYFWKNLECELCKTPYPYETKSLDGKEWLNIIEYDTPVSLRGEDIYYIVLESISSNTSKVIHVVNMDKTHKLYIGRGHDAHVRVTDISVSRLHAFLVKSAQGFYYLVDNESKFGTLALIKTPLEIKPQTAYELQIGRTIFTIAVKKSLANIFSACVCMPNKKPQKKEKILSTTENMISLNGLEYFPKQFASVAFQDAMLKRKSVSVKLISRRLKKKAQDKDQHEILLVKDTQQEEESALENVDDFIAMQLMSNEQVRLRQQASQQLALQQQVMAEEFGANRNQSEEEVDYDEEEEEEAEEEEFEPDQSLEREEEQESESSEQSQQSEELRQEQIEQEQLERAITESLAIQQQLDLQQRQRRRLIIEEEVKEESPNQDDKKKFLKIERNDNSAMTIHEVDLVSSMSTARVSQSMFEIKQRIIPATQEIRMIENNDQLCVEDNLNLSDQNIPISLMQVKERNELTPKPKMLQNSERDSPLDYLDLSKSSHLLMTQKLPSKLQTTRVTAIREIIGEEDDTQDQIVRAVGSFIQVQEASRQNQRQILQGLTLDQYATGQPTEMLSQHSFNNNNIPI